MPSKLGLSRYLSHGDGELFAGDGALAFVSAHIPEENKAHEDFASLISRLKSHGFQVVCDIDAQTPQAFHLKDEEELLNTFQLDFLRLDDGYSLEQIKELVQTLPIALNASTLDPEQKREILDLCPDVLFIHNFYPKEDTGLDLETFERFSREVPLSNLGVFIPGDCELRLPLKEGLVTLEEDRFQPPYTAFVRFQTMGIQHILVADPGISARQIQWIRQAQQGIYPLPCKLRDEGLYNQVFTIRKDSPKGLRRLQESRAYGKEGNEIEPCHNNLSRNIGDICQDNRLFQRYSGEITIVNKPLPARERINTIGHVDPAYVSLLNWIPNGARIQFVPAHSEMDDTDPVN